MSQPVSISPNSSAPPRRAAPHGWIRASIWTIMALSAVFVLLYSEVPLLRQPEELAHLHQLRWLLIPHAIAATFALLIGPLQFSNRLRRRHRRLHRTLGRLYVSCVSLAAPLAVLATAYSHYPKAIYFRAAIGFQAMAWVTSTLIALYAAIHRQLAAHRQWMIRSYAVTFTFVATRIFQPIPAWNHLGRFWFATAIASFTIMALCTPWIDSLLRRSTNYRRALEQANSES